MKKIYSLLITLAAGSALSLSAQQLPNNGFETWENCKPYTSGSANGTTQGTTPTGWTVSNVIGATTGFLDKMANSTIASKATGSTGNAVKVENKTVLSKVIPGYFCLGKTWSTAEGMSGSNQDGGSFGGLDFKYRPDAIEFEYQSEGSQQPTLVLYSWTGTYTQKNVPASIAVQGSATKTDMIDRDRHILGKETPQGGDKSNTPDASCISFIEQRLAAASSSWTKATFDIDYNNELIPEKINVIFAADDYFSTSPNGGNKLTVDNVNLLYYSRLASLSVNGTAVADFDSNTYNYTIDSEMPDESAFSFACLGNSGSGQASISLDKTNAVATITVTNSNIGGTDIDGQTSHIYTIQFNKQQGGGDDQTEYEGTRYVGSLNITLEALGIDVTPEDNVYIKDNGDGTCTFLLPNFTLTLPGSDPANFGNIKVDNVTMTKNADGTITYTGSVKGMTLAGGEVVADVEISGTEEDGKLVMNIPVTWEGLTIDVTFNGEAAAKEPEDEEINLSDYNEYTGDLNIKLEAIGLDVTQEDKVYIKDNGDGTCTFLLRNFTLTLPGSDPANFGDIKVDNVTMDKAGTTTTYSGHVDGMSLAGGEVIADVDLSGTEENNRLTMIIPVTWEGMTIDVTFNGDMTLAGIEDIEIDNSDKPVEYYNLNGMRVNGDNLVPGIYIRRQGTDVTKILVK